jgi:hypothetical protein
MSEIIVYDQIPAGQLTTAIHEYGDDLSKSGFINCSNHSQGRMLAWECFARKITAMELAQKFHIVDNKLAMKADAMLAEFRQQKGKHKIICRTPEKAEIELTDENGETNRFSFAWEEALEEPFVWNGNRKDVLAAITAKKTEKLTLNPNYASPRKRMQMLWARVVSDGIRAMKPEVNYGRYTPEDLEGDEDGGGVSVQVEGEKPTNGNGKAKKPATPKTPTTPETAQPGEGEIDAEFEVVADSTPQKSKLIEAIRTHWQQLGATLDDQAAMVGKERCGRPGAAALIGLDQEQLSDLESRLRTKVSEVRRAGELNGASGATNDTQADQKTVEAEEVPFDIDEEPTGPISDIQIAAAKELIQKLQATEPLITDTIKEQLKIIGKAKLSELSAAQANVLISDLKKGDTKLSGAAMYFQESLQPVPHYATEAGN